MNRNTAPKTKNNTSGDYFLFFVLIVVSILFFASSKIWSWGIDFEKKNYQNHTSGSTSNLRWEARVTKLIQVHADEWKAYKNELD